jgi:glycine/D-amino acid oxidase-like deaminating enzyme
MNGRRSAAPESLWHAATPPGPELPVLAGEERCDAVVIGAGFTGLSAALHLAEAGIDAVVVEAAEPGFGASGRNNGQVIPTLSRADPEAIVARHGAAGERFVALLRDSAHELFDLVRRHGIAAEAEETGWVQPAHSPGRVRISAERVRQWAKWGAPVELLGRDEVRAMTGSDAWHGGFRNRSGGHVNPLALTRGLAGAALAAGARIFVRSPALSYAREGDGWIIRTDTGLVRGKALVIATNAYSDAFAPLAPALAREIVPVLSWQMATPPLGEALRRKILPGRPAMSDTHGDLHFARWDARNRLVTGGALVNPVNGAERLRPWIAARLKRLWPEIGDVTFDHVWNGAIGMTPDHLPRLHRLGRDAYAWAGCNGRAVALSVALGREFARAVAGAPDRDLALPFTDPAPLPAHGLLTRLSPLMLLLYRRRDAREVA